NEPDLGCLEVCKILDTSDVVGPLTGLPDGTFNITVTGPSYPAGTTLSFPVVDGAIVGESCKDVEDLTPGIYTVTETSIPSGWSLQGISGSPAIVSADDDCGDVWVEVTNEPDLGCLEVTKVVDLDEYPFASSANATFNITLTGPSYPTGLDLIFEMTNGEVVYVDDLGTASACLCDLIPGNYTVTEDLPVGWNLTGITPPQPVAVESGTACNDTAVEVTVTNRLLIPHTTMSEMTYVYDSASGNVTINITDCNDGEVPLADAVVYLRANNVTYPFSPMGYSSPYFAGGDTNLNPGDSAGVMDPGECWTWVVTVTINGTTFFEAWGDATDPLGNPVGYDPDTGEGMISEYQSFEIAACWGDETAWAYGGPGHANALWDYVDSNNWGWTNNITEGSYLWPVYAGAGQNDLSKGTLVGNVSVDYAGGCVNVTYSMNASYYLGETHLWVGEDPLPEVTRGRRTVYTNAPGQFPYGVDYGFNSTDPGTWETEWSWSGCGYSGEIYVAAHGVVWMEVECEEEPMVSITQTESVSQPYLWSASSWWTQWSWWY
ncbi:collagen binding domain-containing protein, partial [Chloroflexota bacterium]